MTWIIVSPAGDLVVYGTWHQVIEAGEDEGAVIRRYSDRHGGETCPILRRGFLMAPARMIPEFSEYGLADTLVAAQI
jgi:hypothetical protein